jgi:hypothetical protein
MILHNGQAKDIDGNDIGIVALVTCCAPGINEEEEANRVVLGPYWIVDALPGPIPDLWDLGEPYGSAG